MAIFSSKKANETELGFGSKNYKNSVRFLNADGSINVKRTGLGKNNLDIYHWLITISLQKLIGLILVFYTGVNIFFASVYYILGVNGFGGIDSTNEINKYLDLIYFSAQTITTVGYGHVYPVGHMVNIITAVESLTGLMIFAIITGVVFGRFSRPKSSLVYSKHVLLAPYKEITALMFRVANSKQYELIENEAKVVMTMNNLQTNKREFFNLTLELERISFLALSWTLVHQIDDKSPLFDVSIGELEARDAEIIILIKGINDTFSQTVYSRNSYKSSQFLDKRKFVPVKQEVNEHGQVIISVNDIHIFEEV